MLIFTSISRLFSGIVGAFGTFFSLIGLLLWDFGLGVGNVLLPGKKAGRVYKEGAPGFDGKWPEYRKPGPGDSRSSCPALNALANHGLLNRDGKNIKFTDMSKVIYETFNFAPSFCSFVPHFAANFLQRSYDKDTLNLGDLDVHNCIEHDASLCREDAKFNPDQSKIAVDLVEALLACATGAEKKTGEKMLTPADLSKYTAIRRAHSKKYNSQYTLSTGQRFFGSSNSTTLLIFFGGLISDLRIFLLEERLPEGWETKALSRNGLTIAGFNQTVNKVEFGVDEKKGVKLLEEIEKKGNTNGTGDHAREQTPPPV